MSAPERKHIRMDSAAYSESGRIFSVTIGMSPRSPVFSDLEFGQSCLAELRMLAASTATRVWAYCLMPDHVHLLLEIGTKPLPALIQAWKSRCYQRRREAGCATTFWQRSFFDHAVRTNEDAHAVANYILANPVRRGIAAAARDYPLCGSFVFDAT